MTAAPAKKLESSIIAHVDNQEAWDKITRNNGLLVADIYQEWSGPCKSIASLFNKLHVLINDERCQFAQVRVDNIRSLNLYQGKSEPCFLLFGSGNLVGVIRGSNAPQLKELILQKFDEELKISKGEIERTLIKDPAVRRIQSVDDIPAEDIYDFYPGDMTFCIIKPDLVANEMVDEVIEKIKEHKFDVLRKELRQLTAEEVGTLYRDLVNQEYADEILQYMTSGRCCLVALTSGFVANTVAKLRDITGPTDVEKAKQSDPNSLRALYGVSGYRNGIHTAENREEALRSVLAIFPDLIIRKNDPNLSELERTIMAVPNHLYSEEIASLIDQLKEANCSVIMRTVTNISRADTQYIYKDIICARDLIPERLEEIFGSEFTVLAVQGKDVTKIVNFMQGLYTPDEGEVLDMLKLRVKEDEQPDLIYSSKDQKTALRDYKFFFPIEQTFGIIKPDAYEQKDEIIQLIKAAGYTIPIADEVTFTTDEIAIIYKKLLRASIYPAILENMTSGPSIVMALSKYEAFLDFRDFIGATNPEEASEQGPDKLRGIFGSTMIQNAIHAASSKREAMNCIQIIFGIIQFDEFGNVSGNMQKNLSTFPTKIFRPASIDEMRIQDVLNKCGLENGLVADVQEKELDLREIARLFMAIKNVDSYPNIKCFIVVASYVIPVLNNEENSAFEKLNKINTFPKHQRNLGIREDYWYGNFFNNVITPEHNYFIYSFKGNKEMDAPLLEMRNKFSGENVAGTVETRPEEVPEASKNNLTIKQDIIEAPVNDPVNSAPSQTAGVTYVTTGGIGGRDSKKDVLNKSEDASKLSTHKNVEDKAGSTGEKDKPVEDPSQESPRTEPLEQSEAPPVDLNIPKSP